MTIGAVRVRDEDGSADVSDVTRSARWRAVRLRDTVADAEARATHAHARIYRAATVTRTPAERGLSRIAPASTMNAAIWSVWVPVGTAGNRQEQANPLAEAVFAHRTSAASERWSSTYMAYWNDASSAASIARWSHPNRSLPAITCESPDVELPDEPPPHAASAAPTSTLASRHRLMRNSLDTHFPTNIIGVCAPVESLPSRF